ncbi:polymerase [Biomphalaria glabrata]
MILARQFKKRRRWFVKRSSIPMNHPFKKHILRNTWPTLAQSTFAADCWDELELSQIYVLPETVDLAEFLDDKSHSMTIQNPTSPSAHSKQEGSQNCP